MKKLITRQIALTSLVGLALPLSTFASENTYSGQFTLYQDSDGYFHERSSDGSAQNFSFTVSMKTNDQSTGALSWHSEVKPSFPNGYYDDAPGAPSESANTPPTPAEYECKVDLVDPNYLTVKAVLNEIKFANGLIEAWDKIWGIQPSPTTWTQETNHGYSISYTDNAHGYDGSICKKTGLANFSEGATYARSGLPVSLSHGLTMGTANFKNLNGMEIDFSLEFVSGDPATFTTTPGENAYKVSGYNLHPSALIRNEMVDFPGLPHDDESGHYSGGGNINFDLHLKSHTDSK